MCRCSLLLFLLLLHHTRHNRKNICNQSIIKHLYTFTNNTFSIALTRHSLKVTKKNRNETLRMLWEKEEHLILITKLKFYWRLSEITGDSCDLNSLHCPVHHCIDPEHNTSDASLRWQRSGNRQSSAGDGGSSLHNLVYVRIRFTI